MLGRFARGSLDLFVPLVADQQDLEVVAGEPHGLAVHLGDQGAGRVDGLQSAVGGGGHHRRRDAVRAEDDVRAAGTSSTSSTKIAPGCSSSVTTWMLCTICLRT